MIFVGEIRDAESALSAIQAAETGHLVISTLHTIDCMETINRVLDLFPPSSSGRSGRRSPGALRGIVSQRLVPAADGKGRVPAVEVLVNTGRVFDRIVDPDADRRDRRRDRRGRLLRDADLRPGARQARAGRPRHHDDARRTATNPHDFDLQMAGVLDRTTGFVPVDAHGRVRAEPAAP